MSTGTTSEEQGTAATPPREVCAAYGFEAARFEPVSIGLINQTLRVFLGDEPAPRYVLQRLHPVFGAAVNVDIDAVTRHLEARGLRTPRVFPTRAGALHVAHGDRVYRALTYVPGRCVAKLPDALAARAAGALVGAFHAAVADCAHVFAHVRPGVHDTPRHLARLRAARDEHRAGAAGARDDEARAWLDAAEALAAQVLDAAAALPPLPVTPARVVHGDLKVSNLLFDEALREGVALVDLDTLARGSLPVELGDALRSWCNPATEDEPAPTFSRELFAAALEGYGRAAGALLEPDEARSLVAATETIALELAARFCVDAFEDRYFGWDPTRFASRRAHNVTRARGQLGLAQSVRAQRDALEGLAREALRYR